MKPIAVTSLGILLIASMALAQPASKDKAFTWQREEGSLSLMQGRQVIWRFRYGQADSKPAFDPVAIPGGPAMTWFRPEDHPWHRGLWFSWKLINGVNYWEENKATGLSAGLTELKTAKVEMNPDFSARIEMDLSYHPAKAEPVLVEHRVIDISPPDSAGRYHMDWTLAFTAGDKDVLLDRTPLPGEPGGQSFGGYAGLSVRLAKEMQEVRAISSAAAEREGGLPFAGGRWRGKASGLDYSGTLAGREVGMAMLDHPQNVNAPSPWYVINDRTFHYFNAALLCYKSHPLKAGEKMTLRYRVLVHPGRLDSEQLKAEAAKFAGGK